MSAAETAADTAADTAAGDAGTSSWQNTIEGEWYGRPSVFAPDGTHQGTIKVSRASERRGDQTVYWMDTAFEVGSLLRGRLEGDAWNFMLDDDEKARVYLGPDIYGAGHPYGLLVDAHYYAPGWEADLRTMNHVLADGTTQVYSSLLYDGPTVAAVFNGIYTVAFDHDTNAATQARVAEWCEAEAGRGTRPHVLPGKQSGRWTGTLEAWSAEQEPVGKVEVELTHRPLDLLRTEQVLSLSGVLDDTLRFVRSRHGHRHTWDGPDLYGNAIGYGRAVYLSNHLHGVARKRTGREFLIDDGHTMSVVWQWFEGDVRTLMTFGVLEWEPDA